MISGPVPLYANVPIQPEDYNPSRFDISAITMGRTTTVTATVDMNYVVGQLTRLIIPPTAGCRQLNEVESYVISLPSSTQLELQLDTSRGVDAFVLPTTSSQPQILCIGDINMGIISSTGRVIPTTNIPGSFINVS